MNRNDGDRPTPVPAARWEGWAGGHPVLAAVLEVAVGTTIMALVVARVSPDGMSWFAGAQLGFVLGVLSAAALYLRLHPRERDHWMLGIAAAGCAGVCALMVLENVALAVVAAAVGAPTAIWANREGLRSARVMTERERLRTADPADPSTT